MARVPTPGWFRRRSGGVRAAGATTVLLVLIATAAVTVDRERVGEAVLAGCWELVLLAVVLNALSGVCKAVVWQGLLDGLPSARGRTRPLALVPALFAGAVVNAVAVARAGDVARVALAHRRLAAAGGGIGPGHITGSVAAEHVVSTAAFGLTVAALGHPAGLHDGAVVVTGLIGVGCLLIVVATGLRCPTGAPGGPAGWRGRARRALHAARHGLHAAHRVSLGRAAVRVWTAAVGQWLLAAAAVACCLAAFDVAAGPGPTLAVLTALTLAHAVPVTPGGIGVNQAAAMVPLTALYGVPPETALAAVMAVGVADTAVGAVVGPPCLWWETRRRVAGSRRARHPAPERLGGADGAPEEPLPADPPYSPAGPSGSKW